MKPADLAGVCDVHSIRDFNCSSKSNECELGFKKSKLEKAVLWCVTTSRISSFMCAMTVFTTQFLLCLKNDPRSFIHGYKTVCKI